MNMALADAWEVRDLRRFLIGDSVSKIGRAAFMVAAGWTVNLHGGPTWFALFGISYFMAHIPLLTFGGMLVDRIPRRTVALYTDFIQAGFALLFILLLLSGFPLTKVLVLAAFLMEIGRAHV